MLIMSEKTVLLPTVLTLFDGAAAGAGGGASAGAGTGAATGGVVTGTQGQQQRPGAKKSDSEPVVVYGKQDTAQKAIAQTTPEQKDETSPYANLPQEEREKAYYKLVRGEFKDLFAAHTQKIINDRFKQVSQLESRLNEVQPIIDMLISRYGVKSIAELNARLEEEVLPELAEEAGMTPEAYKRQMQLEAENKKLKEQNKQKEVNDRVEGWQKQAAAMRGTPDRPGKYPDFDLITCAEHPKYGPKFLKLLESGIDVEAAYLAAFHEEIIGKTQVATAKAVESATLQAIRSGAMRPPEVGAKPSSGIIHKSSVSQLTAEDRRRIAELAKRGQKIKF